LRPADLSAIGEHHLSPNWDKFAPPGLPSADDFCTARIGEAARLPLQSFYLN